MQYKKPRKVIGWPGHEGPPGIQPSVASKVMG